MHLNVLGKPVRRLLAAVLPMAMLVLAPPSVWAQVTNHSLMQSGSGGVAASPPSDWPARDVVLYGGRASANQTLVLSPESAQDQFPLNLGVTADVRLERGMAAVGYAFARLDPETAAKIYRLHVGENNENLGSRFVWLGDRGSAMHATLFMVDSATMINAEGADRVGQPSYMDLSVETQKLLSDRIRFEAGLSKALFLRNGEAGQFNGFTSDVNQGMTVQAGVGYVPLNNITLNLESMYRSDSGATTNDNGRAINFSGEWAARESVLLGAAFIYYDQEDQAQDSSPSVYVGSPSDGQTIQFQAFIDLDSANNFVLGVKAQHHGRTSAPFGYSNPATQPTTIPSTIFEVSISSDF